MRALLRRDRDHQRSSDGHGPAQAVTSAHGASSTERRPGAVVSRHRPETLTGSPRASTSSARSGVGCTTTGAGGGIWPGHGAPRVLSSWGSVAFHVTNRARWAGPRPPWRRAVTTPSG